MRWETDGHQGQADRSQDRCQHEHRAGITQMRIEADQRDYAEEAHQDGQPGPGEEPPVGLLDVDDPLTPDPPGLGG